MFYLRNKFVSLIQFFERDSDITYKEEFHYIFIKPPPRNVYKYKTRENRSNLVKICVCINSREGGDTGIAPIILFNLSNLLAQNV